MAPTVDDLKGGAEIKEDNYIHSFLARNSRFKILREADLFNLMKYLNDEDLTFSCLSDCTAPFMIHFHTDATADAIIAANPVQISRGNHSF